MYFCKKYDAGYRRYNTIGGHSVRECTDIRQDKRFYTDYGLCSFDPQSHSRL